MFSCVHNSLSATGTRKKIGMAILWTHRIFLTSPAIFHLRYTSEEIIGLVAKFLQAQEVKFKCQDGMWDRVRCPRDEVGGKLHTLRRSSEWIGQNQIDMKFVV